MNNERAMTNRDRLFAALNGESSDHVPVWLLFPYHSTGYYVDVRTAPAYQPVFEASKRLAIMLNRRNLGVTRHTPEVVLRHETVTDGAQTIRRDVLTYKGRSLTSEVRQGPEGTVVFKFLRSDEDLEFFCSLPVLQDKSAIEAALEAQMARYRREQAEFPIENGAMMLDLGEPVGSVYHLSSLDEYPIWSLTHNDLIVDFLRREMERLRQVYRFCLERNLADVYFLVGSELASPPLVSRATFQQWIVPFASELIEMIHAYGKKAIQHYHGQIREILPDFLAMAPDALHTIEAPPIGNCTFTQAYEALGDRITLIGNIQYDDFRSMPPEQMAAAVRGVLEECRGRRLILSPSAGPFDPAPPARLAENYHVFMRTAWEYGPWAIA
jgi:uroporphyrinogen-III decarboxylase